MNDNNQEFLNAYNRLDNYLKRITGVSGNINLISYLERILPERQQSELKTIRGYKNTIESHGVNPGYKKPIVPYEWVRWLENELNYCKLNEDKISYKLKKILPNNSSVSQYKKPYYSSSDRQQQKKIKIIFSDSRNRIDLYSNVGQTKNVKYYALNGQRIGTIFKCVLNIENHIKYDENTTVSVCAGKFSDFFSGYSLVDHYGNLLPDDAFIYKCSIPTLNEDYSQYVSSFFAVDPMRICSGMVSEAWFICALHWEIPDPDSFYSHKYMKLLGLYHVYLDRDKELWTITKMAYGRDIPALEWDKMNEI